MSEPIRTKLKLDFVALARDLTLTPGHFPWPFTEELLLEVYRWFVAGAARYAAKIARVPPALRDARGALLGLVRVTGPSRPLRPEDEDAACFYEPDRHAWPLASATPFPRPVPVPRGPQKFSSLPRADVLRFLRGEP